MDATLRLPRLARDLLSHPQPPALPTLSVRCILQYCRLGLAVSLACFLSVGAASADFTFEFGLAGLSPVSDFTINGIGNTIDVEVYLKEFGIDPGNILSSEGLFSSAVLVTFDSPLGIAAVQDVSDITANPAFDFVVPRVLPIFTILDVAAFFNPTVLPDNSNRILLGTFRFTGLSVGSVIITASDLDPRLDETVTGQGTVLDALIVPSSAIITVAVIPEPASRTLAMLGISGLLASMWRRRSSVTHGL